MVLSCGVAPVERMVSGIPVGACGKLELCAGSSKVLWERF